MSSNSSTRPETKWVDDAIFSDDTSFAVRVQKLEGFKPRYSMQIGRMKVEPNGTKRFSPFFSPMVTVENAKVALHPTNGQAILSLLGRAEHHIYERLQTREDELLTQKQFKEMKQVNHGKPVTKSTGKTARKKEKRRGGPQPHA